MIYQPAAVMCIHAVHRERWNTDVYADGTPACTQPASSLMDGNSEGSQHFLVGCELYSVVVL